MTVMHDEASILRSGGGEVRNPVRADVKCVQAGTAGRGRCREPSLPAAQPAAPPTSHPRLWIELWEWRRREGTTKQPSLISPIVLCGW